MAMVASVPVFFNIPPTISLTVQSPAIKPPPTQNSNLSLLRICTHLREATQIHALMIKTSQFADAYSAGRLAEFYALSDGGSLDYVEKVLNTFEDPPAFMYNTLMRAYFDRGDPLQSIKLYRRMLVEFVEPDDYTFIFALKACTRLCALSIGLQLHSHAIKLGLGTNAHVRNKLIHLYAICGRIHHARKVFDGSTDLDVVAWNTMLEGYADNKDGENLVKLFQLMPARDVVSWNTMIAHSVEVGEFEEALLVFRSLQESKECFPDRVSFVSLVSALTQLGALAQGLWAHAYILRNGVELDENLNSALINMYSKCGYIEGAVYTFDMANRSSVDTWNAMISGFTANGHSLKAIDLFAKMKASGVMPNMVTFACVLNACSHGGLVDKGVEYFQKMKSVYRIMPDIGHYGCMVDLLCRAGLFEDAEELIEQMPMEPDKVMWKTILGACRVHKNFNLGEKAGLRLIEVAPKDHTGYVLLSNIYSMANKWNRASKVRKLMQDRGVIKVPGCSSLELDGMVHEFIAGDAAHSRKKEIYDMLDEMSAQLKLAGYEPDTTQVLLDVDEEEAKESSLFLHSEKLAVAFGLIGTRPGTTIRVVKNLRICQDCHCALKLLSKIYGRDMIVRDSNRFHHFSKGTCSCMEYW